MKQAIFILAVFLYFSAEGQQTTNPVITDLKPYPPITINTTKKNKLTLQHYYVKSESKSISFSLSTPDVPTFNFKPLQSYLSADLKYYGLQQKTKEWTQFSSDALNSYYKKSWLDNKNSVQQRWMIQKMKEK